VAKGKQLDISVVGLCMFTKDVTPELAMAAVHSLKCADVAASAE